SPSSEPKRHLSCGIDVIEWGRHSESFRTKPALSRRIADLRVANDIGSAARPSQHRTCEGHRVGFTAAEGGNPGDLPAPQQRATEARGRGQVAFSLPER